METDHEEFVEKTQAPCQQRASKPLACRTDAQKYSVAEEASYHDLPPTLARIAKFLSTKDG